MNLTIKYNLSEKDWDAYVATAADDGGFLQSWPWGEFQSSCGRKIFRLAVFEGKKILATVLLVKQEMPLGFCYLYAPRGPVIINNFKFQISNFKLIEFLFAQIKKIAKKERALFFRLDPAWRESETLEKLGCCLIGEVQPKSTLILDLALSEEELLKQMKPKTRYNIKLAQKHGISIVESDKSEEDFDQFWRLLQKTSERDGIKSHSAEYYRQMLKIAGVRLVFARLGDKFVAANIMARFGTWEIYLHGASDYDWRDKMGPYLLQWQMIAAAKKSGAKHYDFWGANATKWPGVTRFKAGFAPEAKLTEYIGAYDLAYKKFFYRLYKLVKRI